MTAPATAPALTTETDGGRAAGHIRAGEMTVAGLALKDYRTQSLAGCQHDLSHVAGYAVRETMGGRGAGVLIRPDGGLGYDVAAIDGANLYHVALHLIEAYRRVRRLAVADWLYVCGCRS